MECPGAFIHLFFSELLVSGVAAIGTIKALYPAAWGALQVFTGPLSDRWGRKWLIAGGMTRASRCDLAYGRSSEVPGLDRSSSVAGVGTAMVYPTLLAAIS